MKPIVIYHHPCNDGFAGAWAAKQKYPDAICRPASHGKPFPLEGIDQQHLIFIDIVPPTIDDLHDITARAYKVTILDHHKTAVEMMEGFSRANLTVVLDMERSGTGIAWDYFFPDDVIRPWLVNTIEDSDLWRFQYQTTKPLIEFIRSKPQTFEVLDRLADYNPKKVKQLVSQGSAILRFKKIQIEQSVEFSQLVWFETHQIYISNVPFFLCNEVAGELAMKTEENGGIPLGITYYQRSDGKWSLSFRTNGDYDCSEIAKRYGGGGHRNASGATVDELPWSKI